MGPMQSAYSVDVRRSFACASGLYVARMLDTAPFWLGWCPRCASASRACSSKTHRRTRSPIGASAAGDRGRSSPEGRILPEKRFRSDGFNPFPTYSLVVKGTPAARIRFAQPMTMCLQDYDDQNN